jgi:hypothetical protein
MARYRSSEALRIEKPCGESWEAMAGTSSVRHCESCRHDVLNVAAMTPAQIEAMLAQPGPRPCMRLVVFEDGSLLTASERRALGPLGRLGAVAASAAMALGGMMAAAQSSTSRPKEAVIAGQVLDVNGKAAPQVEVTINRILPSGILYRKSATTDADGHFRIVAEPGSYGLGALSHARESTAQANRQIVLHEGEQNMPPLKLERMVVLLGAPPPPPPPQPAKATPEPR